MKFLLPLISFTLLAGTSGLRAQPAQDASPAEPALVSETPPPVVVTPVAAEPALENVPAAPVAPPPPPVPDPVPRQSKRDIVMFGADALLPAGEYANEVVAIFGNSVVEGEVRDEVAAIIGDVSMNGSAREAVAIMGDVTINGTVRGDVVAVLGSVQLGPEARVEGEIVSILGKVERAPGSVVARNVHQISPVGVDLPAIDGLRAWFRHCFAWGRPLAIAENLEWAWFVAGAFLGFYLLLSLVFGRGVAACAQTLEKSPGLTLATSVLTVLLLPILTVLLSITVVGPLLLALAAFGGTLFGKAAFLAWIGRRVTGSPGVRAPVVATLVGGLVLTIFYVIPIVGILMWKLTGILGLGMLVYTIIGAIQRERPAKPQRLPASDMSTIPAAPVATLRTAEPAAGASSFFAAQAPEGAAGQATAEGASIPHQAALPFSSLPRAGFWLRMAATVLDVILVALVTSMFSAAFVPVLALYCFGLWAFKATTIGGIICGLKVVRVDDRPMDWKVALVRCLAAFLSFVVAGLGFIWVAFDPESQSWHDKIAGTTIVRVPKGVPLI